VLSLVTNGGVSFPDSRKVVEVVIDKGVAVPQSFHCRKPCFGAELTHDDVCISHGPNPPSQTCSSVKRGFLKALYKLQSSDKYLYSVACCDTIVSGVLVIETRSRIATALLPHSPWQIASPICSSKRHVSISALPIYSKYLMIYMPNGTASLRQIPQHHS
jgi:hypothetical protein